MSAAPKCVLITGGSRGIGAAAARAAASDGWQVVLTYRHSRVEADAVVEQIRGEGGAAVSIACDVSCEDDVSRAFDACEDHFRPPTGLVNSAGILGKRSTLADISLDRWRETFETNVVGTFLCSREAVRRMAVTDADVASAQNRAIVNVTSMAAVKGAAGEFIDYAASKGAIDSMTLGLAREVASKGIRVNAVRPGLIETDMNIRNSDRLTELVGTVPMGRCGQPSEVAEAIVWLLSGRASYVTGTTIDVAGGR